MNRWSTLQVNSVSEETWSRDMVERHTTLGPLRGPSRCTLAVTGGALKRWFRSLGKLFNVKEKHEMLCSGSVCSPCVPNRPARLRGDSSPILGTV